MESEKGARVLKSVTIPMGEYEGRLQKLINSDGDALVAIHACRVGGSQLEPLALTEKELLTLLYNAMNSGVLSEDFLGQLRDFFEI